MGVPQGRREGEGGCGISPTFEDGHNYTSCYYASKEERYFLLKSGRILLFEQESGMGTLLDEGANLTLLPLPLPHLCLFLKGLFYLDREKPTREEEDVVKRLRREIGRNFFPFLLKDIL